MKTKYFKRTVCTALAGLMLAMTGCGNTDLKGQGNNKVPVVAISISESGGEDGRINDWKVYKEDDSYILSFSDRFHDSPESFEITEQEYEEIMSLDYAKYISEYDESFWEGVADAVYYQTTITYENGAEETTKALMYRATSVMEELVQKYSNQ